VLVGVVASVWITRPMLADVVDQRAANEQVRGNHAGAIALARRALVIDRNAHGAAARIIRLEREDGRFAIALQDADDFEHRGTNALVRAERARVLFAMRRYVDAGRAFDAELDDAASIKARSHRQVLADVLFAETAWELSGDRAAARSEAVRGLRLDPKNKTFSALEKRL
jgi:tetratricopeptide (TPR) repeat protein